MNGLDEGMLYHSIPDYVPKKKTSQTEHKPRQKPRISEDGFINNNANSTPTGEEPRQSDLYQSAADNVGVNMTNTGTPGGESRQSDILRMASSGEMMDSGTPGQ